ARQLVTERVDLARARLPATVKPPQLAPITAPIAAMLKFCMTSTATDPQQALRDLRTFATWTLRPRLLGLPGVAQVTVHGGEVERHGAWGRGRTDRRTARSGAHAGARRGPG